MDKKTHAKVVKKGRAVGVAMARKDLRATLVADRDAREKAAEALVELTLRPSLRPPARMPLRSKLDALAARFADDVVTTLCTAPLAELAGLMRGRLA
jgi:hypothetical protein